MADRIARREFVQRLPMVSAGLAAVSTSTLSGCAGTPYLEPLTRPGGLVFAASSLAEDGGVLLQTPSMERPVYVRRSESGEVLAVLASCTHQGCQPEPLGDRLVCPCHGSEFSFEGAVLAGPADRPLARYQVIEDGDQLIVRVTGDGS